MVKWCETCEQVFTIQKAVLSNTSLSGKLMFLIFDILALNGQTNLGMYNLSERLGIIGKKVVTVFRDAIKEKGKEYAMKLQFTLSGKVP